MFGISRGARARDCPNVAWASFISQNNISVMYEHTKLTVKDVLKYFLKQRGLITKTSLLLDKQK